MKAVDECWLFGVEVKFLLCGLFWGKVELKDGFLKEI